MANSESAQPALLRGEGKKSKKRKKSEETHPWYREQFDRLGGEESFREAEAEGVHPDLVRLAHCMDAEDEDGVVDAMLRVQETLVRQEVELREAVSRATYARAELVKTRQEAERYGGRVEGAGASPSLGGILSRYDDQGSLLARMGIEGDF